MSNHSDEFISGSPLQVTILGSNESREIACVRETPDGPIKTLALGATMSRIVLAFPHTNKSFPPKTFVIEVPEEVVVEYSECLYDLQREAHPELNLPDRVDLVAGRTPSMLKTT